MSTINVDTIKNRSSAINLPNNFKIGGNSIIQGYTASGSEPGSPATGDFWWDSSNDKLYRYINGEFKELGIAAAQFSWGGDRSVTHTGYTSTVSNVLEYHSIGTTGNAQDFGDLTVSRYQTSACSSGTRGVYIAGAGVPPSYSELNVMDYVTIATTGNATDFGDTLSAVDRTAAT